MNPTTATVISPSYEVVKVPAEIYQNWEEITWNMTQSVAQNTMLQLLKAWIEVTYKEYKLCAFYELGEAQSRHLSAEDYCVILIQMTEQEKEASDKNPLPEPLAYGYHTDNNLKRTCGPEEPCLQDQRT